MDKVTNPKEVNFRIPTLCYPSNASRWGRSPKTCEWQYTNCYNEVLDRNYNQNFINLKVFLEINGA